MARRGKKTAAKIETLLTLLTLIMLLGLGWLVSLSFAGSSNAFGRILLYGAAIIVGLVVAYKAASFLKREWATQRILVKTEQRVKLNLSALVIRRDQLVYRDAYNKERFEKWD